MKEFPDINDHISVAQGDWADFCVYMDWATTNGVELKLKPQKRLDL